jgi:hypothetical protein
MADLMNAASPTVEKLNGWDDKVEGIAAELCAVGFGQRRNDSGS